MKQSELICKFNDEHREKFNKELFIRSEDDIIEELKKVILSCQRDKFFTIKVLSFKVIDDYKEINNVLYKYEESLNNKQQKQGNNQQVKEKKKDNKYDFIDLKDSDIKLLIVKYFIKIKNQQDTVNVIIAVPRIVDKFYFRLNGNTYSAIYQIVDASTYNNATSNNKTHSVTLKTMFMPIRIYRNSFSLRTTKKESVKCTNYKSYIFKKHVYALKYILAKFGLYETLNFLHMNGALFISDKDPHNDNLYTFLSKFNENIYISTPKYLFNNDNVVQSLIHTVLESIAKDTNIEDFFDQNFWVRSLGSVFNKSNSEPKGLSVLDSLEFIYDISTRESIHLPYEAKKDVYSILRWMIGEFNALRIKDNLNILTKKIRCAEYIAAMYAMKLSTGIYRISDDKKEADINSIKKVIMTGPMYLLSAITKSQLVNYRNMINDTDSITALKFTYKGTAGIGEKGSKSIPNIYRLIDISNIGCVDLDSSSATDPGITGTICPLTTLQKDMHFIEFEEPNTWETEFTKLMSNYKALVGMKEVITMRKNLLGEEIDKEKLEVVEDSINIIKKLTNPIKKADDDLVFDYIPLEEGENIIYE